MHIRCCSIAALESSAPDRSPGLFTGGGQMGELMRALDWSGTRIGQINGWTYITSSQA